MHLINGDDMEWAVFGISEDEADDDTWDSEEALPS